MRQRLIDIALLTGLGVIALVIAFTLLNLGRGGVSDAAQMQEAAAETRVEATPVVVPVQPDNETAEERETGRVADAGQGPEAAEPEAEEPAGVSRSRSTVPLERIGFSYVTGGAGACGIILEPWRHIAVSRELLERYGCGAEVRLELGEAVAGHESFTAVIADTMSPSFSRTVNVYIAQDEPAFEYGLLDAGTLTVQTEEAAESQ